MVHEPALAIPARYEPEESSQSSRLKKAAPPQGPLKFDEEERSDQPSASKINAVASMPAKKAPTMDPAEIRFARCERGPPSARAARRHGSKYLWQSHAAAQPPVNERMNNTVVMQNYSPPALAFSAFFDQHHGDSYAPHATARNIEKIYIEGKI
jgi:hypothetical protein